MPVFELGSKIPGVSFVGDPNVSGSGAGQTAQLRFDDALLRQAPGAAGTAFTATYVSSKRELTLVGSFSQGLPLLAGQLFLVDLKLVIATKDGSGGKKTFNAAAAKPVVATGTVEWRGEIPKAVGAPNDKIVFDVGHAIGDGTAGFTLKLRSTTSLSKVNVDIKSGAAGIEVIPAEQAVVLSLDGEAALKQATKTQLKQALEKVLGAGKAPNLEPPAFKLRRKFRLSQAGLPLQPTGPPQLSLFPKWPSAPALPGLPEGLKVDLGLPQFNFEFPSLNGGGPTTAPDLGFLFRKCKLELPKLAGFEAFRLEGNLRFLQDGANWKLGFEPSAPGALELPDALGWLLARIRWLPAGIDLDDLPDLAELTVGEWELFKRFQGLLPDAGAPINTAFITSFKILFNEIYKGARALAGAPPGKDIFRIAFAALAERAGELYKVVLELWFAAGLGLDGLRDLVLSLGKLLEPDAFERFLRDLFGDGNFDFGDLLSELLRWAGDQPFDELDDFFETAVKLIAAAVEELDPDELAEQLLELLRDAEDWDLGDVNLDEIPFLKGIPGIDISAFNLPKIDAILGVILGGLAFSVDLPDLTTGRSGISPRLRQLFDDIDLAFRRFDGISTGVDATQVLGLVVALFTNARDDPESELILLRLSRIPILGQLIALTGAVKNLFTSPAPWLPNLFWKPIEDNAKLKVKRFPAASKTNKYLIMSDLHRDQNADEKGLFEFGAISHFKDNADLYLDILKWAERENYTVLEAGDCEELWFIRDFKQHKSFKDTLTRIMDSHKPVYDQLVKMHQAGRYFRTYGNHDSYLREPATRKPLEDRFAKPDASKKLTIYDYFIIDGVKTMDDRGIGDIPDDIKKAQTGQGTRLQRLVGELAEGRLGFDSVPYEARRPLIVTHGHQFDFWNCDENNLVGKMIANGVGVPVDMLDDPFQQLEGLALGGAPLLDFEDTLAELPVFSNFPSYDPSIEFAHRIQHMDEGDRLLINDHFYIELFPALMAAFGMPVHIRDVGATGVPKHKWKDRTLFGEKGFTNFLGNAISVGHTHYPQSRPYYDIAGVLLGPLKILVDLLREAIASIAFGFKPRVNFLRTQYYNSGTTSWMEGLIWAIEIDETGQARLVYWTKDTKVDRPQTMDWELQPWDDAKRAAFDRERDALVKRVEDWVERFIAALAAAGAGMAALSTAAVLAVADLLAATSRDYSLPEIDLTAGAVEGLEDQLRDAMSKIDDVVFQLLLNLVVRQSGTATGLGTSTFKLKVPVAAEVAAQMEKLKLTLTGVAGLNGSGGAIDQAAAVWLLASEAMPMVNGGRGRGKLPAKYPVLWSLLSLLPALPPVPITVGGTTISSSVALAGGELSVNVTVK